MSSNNFTISTKAIYSFFHVIWVLMICLFLIKIIVTIVQPTDIGIPIYFNIPDAGNIIDSESSKISITSAVGTLKYDKAYQPPLLTIIAYQAKSILKMALILFILSQVRLILKNAIEQNPFNRKNSQRLLKIGWAILAVGIINIMAVLFAYTSFDVSHLNLDKSVDCNCDASHKAGMRVGQILASVLKNPYIYIGLVTVALSSAFKTGSRMKEEVDLTI